LATEIQYPPVIGQDLRPRRKWLLVGGLGLLTAAAALLLGNHWRSAAKRKPSPPPATLVSVTTAHTGDIGVYLGAIGTVTPVFTASITSQVNGLVVAVHYRQGEHVVRGDALVDIDSRPYRATLMQAQGTLQRDESLLAQSRMDLERYRAAWARNAIAKQTLDDQEKLVVQNEGVVKNDRGVVQFDQVQVDFCYVRAPISGRVGLRLVDPGNVVQANGNVVLVVVAQTQPITVVFTIPQDNLDSVRAQLARGARLTALALDRTANKTLATGTLAALDNQIDTTTGTVKARADFENADESLFPNEFVNTRLLVDVHRGVTLVDSTAVQQNGTESFVYALEDGVAHVRRVEPKVSDKGVTEVQGLSPGEVIADSSFDRLRDGAAVTIAPAASAAPSGSAPP
jgi:multidrug efflux system membrane fusion protein